MEQPDKAPVASSDSSLAVAPTARGWMVVRLLIFIAIFALGGFLWIACSLDFSITARRAAAVGAVVCLAFPVRVLYVGARRYHRTGSWSISPEERTAWHMRYGSHPPQPWVSLACTATMALVVLLNTISTGIRLYRHHLSTVDGLLAAFWLIFLAAQVRQLYIELHKPSLVSARN